MTFWRFISRSLQFFSRSNLAVILGTMIGTAILTGSLIIGDSVQFSLTKIVFNRLGKTKYVLYSSNHPIGLQHAPKMSRSLNTLVAPIIKSKGIVIIDGGKHRYNNVQVLGVDKHFGLLGEAEATYINLKDDEVIISKALAIRSNLKKGDNLILRIQIPTLIPLETSLSLNKKKTIARTFKIKSIATETEFGNFNLDQSQVAPNTVFLSISYISKLLGTYKKAHLLLFGEREGIPLMKKEIEEAFISEWQPSDAGLIIKNLEKENLQEIKSERIFIDPPIVKAMKKVSEQPYDILTYFVNSISYGESSTPYSFISSPPPSLSLEKLKENEIIINEWLADDLNIKKGDNLNLSYYTIGDQGNLKENHKIFNIIRILPMKPHFLNQDLMPAFPGLSEVENCRDWDPGIPMDLSKIRDKDEKYWDDYRGAPKGYISLKSAQRIWGNKFGNLTTIRFPKINPDRTWVKIKKEINPEALGFIIVPVKEEGLRASKESVDFSMLFLGLSFFIIIAALLLLGLLFTFSIKKRTGEKGLLSALGFNKKTIKNLIRGEGGILAITGTLLGIGLGILYTHLILWTLKMLWNEIVGTSALYIYLKPFTLLTGFLISSSITFITMSLASRNLIKAPVNLIRRIGEISIQSSQKRQLPSMIISLFGSVSIITLLFLTDFGTKPGDVMFFFIGGPVFIITGLALFNFFLIQQKRISPKNLPVFYLSGLKNLKCNRKRTLSLIALLACGIFIVFTVGVNKKNPLKDRKNPNSGTGGYTFFAQTDIPLILDPSTVEGREKLGLNQKILKKSRFLSFMMKDGDDASCLNLNRTAHPAILGIDPLKLSKRKVFTFTNKSKQVDSDNPWESLNMLLPDGSIPAVADQTVIKWSLGKKINDKLFYTNEIGEKIKITLVGGLANSVFQGKIIISKENLKKHFPSIHGFRLFLIDAPWEKTEEMLLEIQRLFEDYGMEIKLASDKLNQFNRVENTYLTIFLILGSFGILLGSIGLGVVVWQNVNDRKGELAVLRALGFNFNILRKMIFREHTIIFSIGIFIGVVSTLLATLPQFFTPGFQLPLSTLVFLLLLILINGFGWIYLAIRMSITQKIISSLGQE